MIDFTVKISARYNVRVPRKKYIIFFEKHILRVMDVRMFNGFLVSYLARAFVTKVIKKISEIYIS